jgi:hypothetical protein
MGASSDGKLVRSLNDVLGKRDIGSTHSVAKNGNKRLKPALQRDEVAGWRDLGQGCRIGKI